MPKLDEDEEPGFPEGVIPSTPSQGREDCPAVVPLLSRPPLVAYAAPVAVGVFRVIRSVRRAIVASSSRQNVNRSSSV